jgi:hypothetical protein
MPTASFFFKIMTPTAPNRAGFRKRSEIPTGERKTRNRLRTAKTKNTRRFLRPGAGSRPLRNQAGERDADGGTPKTNEDGKIGHRAGRRLRTGDSEQKTKNLSAESGVGESRRFSAV